MHGREGSRGNRVNRADDDSSRESRDRRYIEALHKADSKRTTALFGSFDASLTQPPPMPGITTDPTPPSQNNDALNTITNIRRKLVNRNKSNLNFSNIQPIKQEVTNDLATSFLKKEIIPTIPPVPQLSTQVFKPEDLLEPSPAPPLSSTKGPVAPTAVKTPAIPAQETLPGPDNRDTAPLNSTTTTDAVDVPIDAHMTMTDLTPSIKREEDSPERQALREQRRERHKQKRLAKQQAKKERRQAYFAELSSRLRQGHDTQMGDADHTSSTNQKSTTTAAQVPASAFTSVDDMVPDLPSRYRPYSLVLFIQKCKELGAIRVSQAPNAPRKGILPAFDPNDPDSVAERIDISTRDEFGRILSAKEAFQLQSHKFHGTGPGRKRLERQQKAMEREALRKQSGNVVTKDIPAINATIDGPTTTTTAAAIVAPKIDIPRIPTAAEMRQLQRQRLLEMQAKTKKAKGKKK